MQMNLSHFWKNRIATILKIISFIFYAWNDALCKKLTTDIQLPLATHSVIFYQYSIAACILVPLYFNRKEKFRAVIGLRYHLLRAILCTCAIILLNQSFTVMPLSYAVGFNLLSPLITLAWAYLWLREPLSNKKMFALGISAIAYIILIDSSKYQSTTILSLQQCLKPTIALLCFQANTLITKQLLHLGENNTNLTLTLFLLIPTLLLPFELQYLSNLSFNQLAVIACMAINVCVATFALHQAIAMADLTFLLPFGFLKYSIVTFFGYLYFLEIPHTNHMLGIALTMSVLYYINQPDQPALKPAAP